MPPFAAGQGACLVFLRPSDDVQKGERKNVLAILCTQLSSGDYLGTCLTEDKQLHTFAYADLKAVYQRFEQLAASYDVKESRKALELLLHRFLNCVDCEKQIEASERAFDVFPARAKQGQIPRGVRINVVVPETREDLIEGSVSPPPPPPVRTIALKRSKLSLTAQRQAKITIQSAGTAGGDSNNAGQDSNNDGQDSITPPADSKNADYDSNNAGEQSKKGDEEAKNAGQDTNNAGEKSPSVNEEPKNAGGDSNNAGQDSNNDGQDSITPPADSKNADDGSNNAGEESKKGDEQVKNAGGDSNNAEQDSNNDGQDSIRPPAAPKNADKDSNNAGEESKKETKNVDEDNQNAGKDSYNAGKDSNNAGEAANNAVVDDDGPPTSFYSVGDKNKRKRTFSCPVCSHNATGAHQCGGCYKHMHAVCGDAYPGSCEGHGQKRICHDCDEIATGESPSSAASSTTQ
jgi:hypothetical protein